MTTKNKIPALLTLALGCSALIFAGCSKSDRTEAKANVKEAAHDTKVAVQEAAHDAKVAIVDAWADVKGFTFDKHDDFSKHAKALSARMEAQVSELRADYSEAKASASRHAAMEELKNSEANYQEKLSALGTASADTWDAAKQNVILAWDKLDASYRKARAD
ncbi:MAG: hypothetical protein PSW75_06845 [bacterium]|nr:hypothetical protein [bacterium]MDI1336653.1 hypothetical protein [Lacunisphaera sp.]